jgi:predicted Rossmann-fold nucleotide-binding protein
MLAALLLASPLSAQVVSVRPTVPALTGASGSGSVQSPAQAALSAPALGTGLTPSLIPGLSAPVAPVPSAAAPVRALAAIKQLKIGSYNVENLFDHVGEHVPDPANPGKLKKISDAKPKPEWALREEGRIILENDLDILTLAEVEDIQALEDFNTRFLEGKYRTFLIEGNDERGIDIAFLVKKDMPLEIEQRSHKEETWVDPVLGGGPKPLFSRDLTSLVVRAPGKPQPLFVLFGTHYKSKRDRDGRDPESVIMRTAQVQRTAEVMDRYRKEFGADVPMMIAGDFNGDVAAEAAYKPLFDAAGLADSFDAAPVPSSSEERVTHTYHPRGEPAHYAQMDAVLVSQSLRGAVQSAKVYRYKNPDGTERPIPKTYEERELNPSDHFPLFVTLDFAHIRGPASFEEVPPLDARYTGPESRARTVTILGSSKSVDPIKEQIALSASAAGELIRRGYNVLTGAGNAGVMGAAYAAASDNANAAPQAGSPRGENLSMVVRPAWGDENLADARAIGIADSEAERIEKFAKASDSFLIFPGSAGSLQEAATLIAKNAYRGKAELKRIILVGRDFFGGLSQQYQRLFADGLLKERPEALFRVVDTAEELLAGFAPLNGSKALLPAPPAAPSAARAFVDSARRWLASSGAAFDAKNTEWAEWTENPGPVNDLTRSNLRAIRSLIDNLQIAKIGFAREAAAVPAAGELTPEQVRGLFDAWDRLRDAANRTMIIVADSRESDASKRGLVANVDQNTGKTPGGMELFLAPGLSVNWDAARELNEALHAKKP